MKRGFAAQFGGRLKFLSPQQATGNSNLNAYGVKKSILVARSIKKLLLLVKEKTQQHLWHPQLCGSEFF